MGESEGLIYEFKEYFESTKIKKVWHNYSFDRHILHNIGINCQGFYGDTMHMARLWDTGLGLGKFFGGFSSYFLLL